MYAAYCCASVCDDDEEEEEEGRCAFIRVDDLTQPVHDHRQSFVDCTIKREGIVASTIAGMFMRISYLALRDPISRSEAVASSQLLLSDHILRN